MAVSGLLMLTGRLGDVAVDQPKLKIDFWYLKLEPECANYESPLS